MKMPIQFDTLNYAKKLTSAGVPQQQAEAHAAALGDALRRSVVVPADLMLLKQELLAKLEEVRYELMAKIDQQNARTQLVQWMLGVSLTIQIAMFVKMLVP